MDRLNQLRGEAGPSRDCTLDTSSPPSEAYITANESSKYFSLSEEDSSFDIAPLKESLASSSIETERTINEPDRLISNLSPIGKKNDFLDSYKIGKQIEAANILSGGVDIFDDNDNSYDGDELVIDDNAVTEDKGNTELKITEAELKDDNSSEATLVESEPVPSKDTEVILQIDGKNVDAIDIGNGLYLYRREGEEELAAVQIDEDQQQPSFKFLKVRENAEGNLEVYEEIPIEVPKESPIKEGKPNEKSVSHVPIKDINKVISDTSNKNIEGANKTQTEQSTLVNDLNNESNKDHPDSKTEVNGKLMKLSEPRKSPVVGTFTPMAYHSTPTKERIPLTKTMVDLQLHPNRHSDNVKKTIEVHTDNSKQKMEPQRNLSKDFIEDKSKQTANENETDSSEKCLVIEERNQASKTETNQKKNIKDETVEAMITGDTKKESEEINVSPIENKSNQESNKVSVTTDSKCMENLPSTGNKDNSNTYLVENLKQFEKDKTSEDSTMDNLNAFSKNEEQKFTNEQKQDGNSEETEIKTENIQAKKFEDIKINDTVEEKLSNKEDMNNDNKPSNSELEIVGKEVCVVDESNSNKKSDLSFPLPSSDISSTSFARKESMDECIRNKSNITSNNASLKTSPKENKDLKSFDKNIDMKSDKPNKALPIHQNVIPYGQSIKGKDIEESLQEVDKKDVKHIEQIESQDLILDYSKATAEKDTNTNSLSKQSLEKIANTAVHNINDVVDSFSVRKLAKNIMPAKKETSDRNKEFTEYTGTKIPPAKNIDTANIETPKGIEKSKLDPLKKETTGNTAKKEIIPVESVETSKKITAEKVDNPKKETSSTIMKDKTKTMENIGDETKVHPPVSIENRDAHNKEIKPVTHPNVEQDKDSLIDKKVISMLSSNIDLKSVSTNHAPVPVPFGKWTEANRQAFLNKIKETKVHSNSSNGKQIKNSNDLNRRDFLKKIDTHRQTPSNTSTAKVQDFGSSNRLGIKKEASVFTNKPIAQESKLPVKTEASLSKSNATAIKKVLKQESILQSQIDSASMPITETTASTKKEALQRKEINNQDLIDKTIEEIINRAAPSKPQEENVKETITATQSKEAENAKPEQPVGLDEIEMKMNELHGIPFIERPAHELPHVNNPVVKTYTKSESQKVSITRQNKIPNLIPFSNKCQQIGVKENIIDIDSEEEVIEHEPITGDMDTIKKNMNKPPMSEKSGNLTQITSDHSKKEPIITEKDFDKFLRRNSINYENCITVNFDTMESPNMVNTVVPKDTAFKTYSKLEKYDSKITPLTTEQCGVTKSIKQNTKFYALSEENCNKNYQSKVKMAYQTAMTAKRQMERPITIIEDKPVKVVFMDSNAEFIPSQLNAQGKELSPAKKQVVNVDLATTDSLDSDILEIDDGKSLEDTKKTKHQRKQVLTPVDTPDLELIEPDDLGIEVSPKKKRKTEEKVEKSPKTLVPKKSYLLGRGTTTDEVILKSYESPKIFNKTSQDQDNNSPQKNTASAIDNLVKAAELLETQCGNIISQTSPEIKNSDIPQNTPVKRGRGRPRKYPLPQGSPIDKTKVPSPQKKPRLSDAKILKTISTDDEDISDEEKIRENWTMGKINEKIVCPICDKLFRSENVVFKHVKHCTGPSPNRSESGNKSPRRLRESQDSDTRLDSMDGDDFESNQKDVRKTRMSRDKNPKPINEGNEIIVIEDTPIKLKPEKREESKYIDFKKSLVNKNKVNNLICEFCGKTFRQLSYLVNHKLLHKKGDTKKVETDVKTSKTVYSCEVCKKEFRKLHHLVQHRIIHNLNSGTSAKRKSSSEQNESKISKDQSSTKQNDDASAGFRCEPCDKSFRKLHHLVEHRETHDGINRQKNTATVQSSVEKPHPPPQCDVCKKTFRKLHHLIEHKEQHLETSSEKSDDKSIKSSLSTKDIIHECSLCYMVFPNEHSLNKHTVICQRKKRQSASKLTQQAEQVDANEEDKPIKQMEDDIDKDEVIIVSSEIKEKESDVLLLKEIEKQDEHINYNPVHTTGLALDLSTESPSANNVETLKEINVESKEKVMVDDKESIELDISREVKKLDAAEANKILDTPKEHIKVKKTPLKDKLAPTVTKRNKSILPLMIANNVKPADSSDDDEVRYMLNPDFKVDNTAEGKMFMKVRAKKRNSLQIERPDSKDLVKRRISLQHPPKIPRLKPKAVPNKTVPTNASILAKNVVKPPKTEPVPSTDSDDSDIKYSFPKDVFNKINKSNVEEPSSKDQEKKIQRKSLAEKRKSLGGIAKKKSLGKIISPKQKVKPLAEKLIKKRIAEVEHRCDCGQLFSSAALLSRHTTLAHTPPRIRRRRSPLPEISKMVTKPRQISTAAKSRHSEPKKLSGKTNDSGANSKTTQVTATRRSTVNPPEKRKSLKSSDKVDAAINITLKDRRRAAHKGVPVPEKMKKVMEKSKK